MGKTWSLVLQTSGSRLYWLLGSLLTTVVTTRLLGPEGRGLYVAAVGWVMMFATFGHLSLAPVVVYVTAGKPEEEWLPPVVGSLLAIAAATTLTGWAIVAGLYWGTGGDAFQHLSGTMLLVAFLALPPLLWIEIQYGPLLAAGKLSTFNVSQITGASASVLLTLFLVGVLKLGVYGALLAVLLAQLLAVAIPFARLGKALTPLRVDGGMVRDLLKGASKLHLNAIGAYLFSQANVLILNHHRPAAETAHFQLAVQLLVGLQIIPTAVNAVAYSLVSRKGADEAWPEHRRLVVYVLLLVGALAAVAWFVSPLAVRLVFGAAFLPSVPLFRILLFGVVGMTLSLVLTSQWIARGLLLQSALLTLGIGLINVVANWVVVPAYGARGAAWTTVGTYGLWIIASGIMILWVDARHREHVARMALREP